MFTTEAGNDETPSSASVSHTGASLRNSLGLSHGQPLATIKEKPTRDQETQSVEPESTTFERSARSELLRIANVSREQQVIVRFSSDLGTHTFVVLIESRTFTQIQRWANFLIEKRIS